MKDAQTAQQANNQKFQFWVGMFHPRTKKWQREHLRMLRHRESVAMMKEEDIINKINALEYLGN